MSTCNHETESWDQVGTVKHPDQPMCGPKPKNLNDTALCDGETGEWFEVDDTPEPAFASCSGKPPSGMDLAVCNTETGQWEDDHIAMDKKTFESITKKKEEKEK